MLNANKIRADLYGVVGTRQPFNPDYAIIDADNQVSRSGLFVTSNPLCKIEYLKDTQDYRSISDAEFNLTLKRLQEDSIVSVCTKVFNDADYIDRQVLFSNAQNRVNTETLISGLVAFKIQVDPTKDVAFEISRVLLDFEGTGTINLMLFNSSEFEPILSKEIVVSSPHQVEQLNWKVDNSGSTYKGEYYLGYLTNTVEIGTLKPYKRDYDSSNVKSFITHLDVTDVQFVSHATETLPDLTTDEGRSETIGINPDITVYDDYTDLILQNESILSRAINFEFQIAFLNTYLATLRSNLTERSAQAQMMRIIQVLEGQSGSDGGVRITGLSNELGYAIKGVRKEIKKLKEGYFGKGNKVITMI